MYPGGCLPRGGGGCLPRGCLPRAVCVTEADIPSPCGQNSLYTLVKILPCSNFVADGKNYVNIIRTMNRIVQ